MKYFGCSIFLLLVLSCSKENTNKEKAIARVNDSYLYQNDLENLIPSGTPKKDSIALVKDFINRWAMQQLLMNNATKNISKSKQTELDELINQYKIDLYSKAYLEQLVVTKVDTLITKEEIENYYTLNKNNFKANNPLVKLRYINLVKGNNKLKSISAKFSSFKEKDKKELKNLAIQFKDYAFNDSVWVDIEQVYERLPFVNQDNFSKYIDAGISYQYVDATSVWLVKVKNMIPKNNIVPLDYIAPTIKQILLNKRKTDLINKIQTEITNDAIKDNDFEIFK
ncbi:hypothetical protein [Flavobacterium difficile]|uniref:Peptidylprolyl isomerase n=1 Tax=Flavobacterium difficile TaxID=2709659 RepID=A0ABX0I568_9FLAO|nr:hypothetical protein [Flavobacterium difficile]NHM00944.1 hypothetical protein [Flavobacterium difficile]